MCHLPGPSPALARRRQAQAHRRKPCGYGGRYTTDILEGERDGREIARELLTKPEFLARIAEDKAELGGKP